MGSARAVGKLLIQQEEGKYIVPVQIMDVVGAMIQGQIGYMLQQTLTNYLRDAGIDTPVCGVVNQVLVNKDDPEFFSEAASKPIGNFFTEEDAIKIKKEHPEYIIKKVKPVGERTGEERSLLRIR